MIVQKHVLLGVHLEYHNWLQNLWNGCFLAREKIERSVSVMDTHNISDGKIKKVVPN